MTCLINGVKSDTVSVLDRGLAFGDGVFETILLRKGHMQLVQKHLGRLTNGCERLNIDLDLEKLQSEMDEACNQEPDANYLKMIVTTGDGGVGYNRGPGKSRRIVMTGYRKPWPHRWYKEGIDLHICRTCCIDNPALTGIKHLNRLQQILARSEWDDEYQEGIMLDYRGHVIECTASNIFMLHGNSLITPRLDRCGVPGVMREHLLERAARAGLVTVEMRISVGHLLSADSVSICNSLIGICSVKSIDGQLVGKASHSN